MMKKPLILLSTVATLTLSLPGGADEITDQIRKGTEAYRAGELHTAVDSLNFAIARIQEQITNRLSRLLPDPLPGWQADPPESQAGGIASMLTGTTLSRRYYREDGAEVSLDLSADSPMLPMLTAAFSMPLMMETNPDLKTYSLKGHRGMVERTPGSDEYSITLMVGKRLVVQGKGTGIPDQKPIESYLERLDLDAIKNALTD